MSSQKLKRISLSIVVLLILVTAFWLLYDMFDWWDFYGIHHIAIWEIALFYSSRALILILALYLIAKILIEIFK